MFRAVEVKNYQYEELPFQLTERKLKLGKVIRTNGVLYAKTKDEIYEIAEDSTGRICLIYVSNFHPELQETFKRFFGIYALCSNEPWGKISPPMKYCQPFGDLEE